MVLPYLARFRVGSGFSFLPCQYHEPTAPMNNCSPFCNEIGNDLDPDTNGGLYTYISNGGSQSSLARALPVVTPLSWQEIRISSQCRGNVIHPCYTLWSFLLFIDLFYWFFYQIKFNQFGPKGAFYYILLNIRFGKTEPQYKFKFSPKILKHFILVNASISLT